MSFVRSTRSFHQSGMKKKKPVRKKPVPAWDSTQQDLSVLRASPEELARRKASHKSHNLMKSQAVHQPASLNESVLNTRQLSILKEVLYDKQQLHDALAKSDKMLSVVCDMFGDDPKRTTGFPNVTIAPDADTADHSALVAALPDMTTRTEKLSETTMNGMALNELQSDSEESESEEPLMYSSKMNMERFQQFLASEEQDATTISSIAGPGRRPPAGQYGAAHSTRLPDNNVSQSIADGSIFETPPQKQAVSRIPKSPGGSAVNDGRKLKKTKKLNASVAHNQSKMNASVFGGTDLKQALLDLQDEISGYEAEAGYLGNNDHKPPEGFSGYTVALVDGVTRLTRHLKQLDERLKAEVGVREELQHKVVELRSLVDALTADLILTQEEYATVLNSFENYKISTGAEIKMIRQCLDKSGLMHGSLLQSTIQQHSASVMPHRQSVLQHASPHHASPHHPVLDPSLGATTVMAQRQSVMQHSQYPTAMNPQHSVINPHVSSVMPQSSHQLGATMTANRQQPDQDPGALSILDMTASVRQDGYNIMEHDGTGYSLDISSIPSHVQPPPAQAGAALLLTPPMQRTIRRTQPHPGEQPSHATEHSLPSVPAESDHDSAPFDISEMQHDRAPPQHSMHATVTQHRHGEPQGPQPSATIRKYHDDIPSVAIAQVPTLSANSLSVQELSGRSKAAPVPLSSHPMSVSIARPMPFTQPPGNHGNDPMRSRMGATAQTNTQDNLQNILARLQTTNLATQQHAKSQIRTVRASNSPHASDNGLFPQQSAFEVCSPLHAQSRVQSVFADKSLPQFDDELNTPKFQRERSLIATQIAALNKQHEEAESRLGELMKARDIESIEPDAMLTYSRHTARHNGMDGQMEHGQPDIVDHGMFGRTGIPDELTNVNTGAISPPMSPISGLSEGPLPGYQSQIGGLGATHRNISICVPTVDMDDSVGTL